jgi:hypothetical protein
MKTTINNVSKNSGVIAYFFEGGAIFFAGTVASQHPVLIVYTVEEY